MTAQERLRAAIAEELARLRAGVPADREAAILALIRVQDRLPGTPALEPAPDLITGRRIANLGGNRALQLCLEAPGAEAAVSGASAPDLDRWGERLLAACGELARAELVLAHCETGFMRLVEAGDGTFAAWIATKRAPTAWRERADIDWWAAWLARQHEPALHALQSQAPVPAGGGSAGAVIYRRLADVYLEMMAYQLGYPADAVIGDCTVQTYRDVLAGLIALALAERDRGEPPSPQSETGLIAAIAATLAADPAIVGRAVAALTLDPEGAAYHAAVPGVAAAPLVRLGPDRLVWSIHGLTTEPLLFLTRELKRRDAEGYHNSAFLREGVFRRDLYDLFADRRFVTSPGRIQVRRDDGNVRTDIDAVIFDRKSGTLGLFELKTQDPFARSTAELARQRDNVLYANRQVSGVLAWLKRHGADEILARVDSRTAKTFRAQKVYPFVLGRYLAHFSDGAEPDRRAAWGTWPQLLRLLDGQPVRAAEANPLASLFTRLTKDVPLIRPIANGDTAGIAEGEAQREIALGPARLVVHPSYAAFQAGAGAERGAG